MTTRLIILGLHNVTRLSYELEHFTHFIFSKLTDSPLLLYNTYDALFTHSGIWRKDRIGE